MASQREFESVIWYALQELLKGQTAEELYEYFYSSQNVPHTQAQHKRFLAACEKVQGQMEKFEGDNRV